MQEIHCEQFVVVSGMYCNSLMHYVHQTQAWDREPELGVWNLKLANIVVKKGCDYQKQVHWNV